MRAVAGRRANRPAEEDSRCAARTIPSALRGTARKARWRWRPASASTATSADIRRRRRRASRSRAIGHRRRARMAFHRDAAELRSRSKSTMNVTVEFQAQRRSSSAAAAANISVRRVRCWHIAHAVIVASPTPVQLGKTAHSSAAAREIPWQSDCTTRGAHVSAHTSAHSERHSEFRVEKSRAEATLTLSNGTSVHGCFFIAGNSRTHVGPERVEGRAEQRDRIFSVRRAARRRVAHRALQPRPSSCSWSSPTQTSRAAIRVTTSQLERIVTMLMSNGDAAARRRARVSSARARSPERFRAGRRDVPLSRGRSRDLPLQHSSRGGTGRGDPRTMSLTSTVEPARAPRRLLRTRHRSAV